MGASLVRPRIPSVPKNFRPIWAALARKSSAEKGKDACGAISERTMRPGRDKPEDCAGDQGEPIGGLQPFAIGDEAGLRSPLPPDVAEQHFLLSILKRCTDQCQKCTCR